MNSNNTFNKSKNYAQHISKPLFALFQSFFKNPLYELKIRKKYTIYKPSDLDIYFRYSFVELPTEFPSKTTTRSSKIVIVSFPKHMKNIGVFIISKDAEIDNSNLYFFPLTQKNLYVYNKDNDLNYYYIKIKDLGYICRLNNYNYSYQEFLRWVGEENRSKLNESFYNPTISGDKFISQNKTHIRPATDQEIEEIYSPPKKEIISNMTNNNENTFVIERKKTLKYKNLPEITIDFSENESNNIFYQEGKYPYTSVNIDITIEKDECNKEKIEDLKVLITKALDEIIEN